MTENITLNKEDRPEAFAVKIAEKVEKVAYDGRKVGLAITIAGLVISFASSETARKASVKYINSVYDKFRGKYDISDDKIILVNKDNIEIIK